MSSLGTSDDFTIMRLRVKGSKLDPLAVRPRVQQLISEISLYPLLPESASLFIRKLEDPSPGLLRLEAIDSRATQAWRRSFNSRFRELATSAARPAHGPISSSVESVVFLDYSELLACLTADWCNGFVGARWWWHSFLQRGDSEQLIRKLWVEKIEYVPAALQQLAKTPVLLEFVSALSDREIQELVERLVDRFALTELRQIAVSLFQDVSEEKVDLSFSSLPVAIEEAEVRRVAPWKHVAPECDTPKLRPVQQLFLGIGLMVKRAPVMVRSQAFAREVEHWVLRVLSGVGEIREQIQEAKAGESKPQILRIETDRSVAAGEIEVREFGIEDEPAKEAIALPVVSRERVELVSSVPEITRTEKLVVDENVENDLVEVASEAEFETVPQELALVDESHMIETELGGLFYLINLGIFLGIYSDFTSPVESFTEVDIWNFVALVGADLNDHQDPDDPIWTLLENLRQPEGSDLCDFASLREKTLIWLSHLMPYIRKRLRRALGTDDFSNVLLRHRARVTITATHADVFFSLAELPIEIRLSGLDRDPGWVPAAGRFIAFHYE